MRLHLRVTPGAGMPLHDCFNKRFLRALRTGEFLRHVIEGGADNLVIDRMTGEAVAAPGDFLALRLRPLAATDQDESKARDAGKMTEPEKHALFFPGDVASNQ